MKSRIIFLVALSVSVGFSVPAVASDQAQAKPLSLVAVSDPTALIKSNELLFLPIFCDAQQNVYVRTSAANQLFSSPLMKFDGKGASWRFDGASSKDGNKIQVHLYSVTPNSSVYALGLLEEGPEIGKPIIIKFDEEGAKRSEWILRDLIDVTPSAFAVFETGGSIVVGTKKVHGRMRPFATLFGPDGKQLRDMLQPLGLRGQSDRAASVMSDAGIAYSTTGTIYFLPSKATPSLVEVNEHGDVISQVKLKLGIGMLPIDLRIFGPYALVLARDQKSEGSYRPVFMSFDVQSGSPYFEYKNETTGALACYDGRQFKLVLDDKEGNLAVITAAPR